MQTLWEKEKMLVSSIFSFFLNVCLKASFSGSFNLSQTRSGFYMSAEQIFENTEGKGETARNNQFLLFPQGFLPIWKTSCRFHEILNSHLQTLSVWKSLKFVIWELGLCGKRLKPFSIFVAFVEDNATMSSIGYFENHVSYFVQN